MRTKHLLYTLALAGTFAACTNEEFVSAPGAQNGQVQERPLISNPTLSIADNAETRFGYNGNGFYFEDGDKISALLMDENNTGVRYGSTTDAEEWAKLTWLEKYHLVDYVHTNFPFVYDGNGFSANCNMLEGNYFLAYPYICLSGERQAKKDISSQTMVGDGSKQEVRVNFMKDHQFFVGYAQLAAGQGVSDFKASLVPVLAPVRFAIKSNTNNYTTYHVTKIVVSHSQLSGVLNIDPTRAGYGINKEVDLLQGTWNLRQAYVEEIANETSDVKDIWHFNYANFLAHQSATAGDKDWKNELYENERYGTLLDEDKVYNITGEVGEIDDVRKDRKMGAYYWDDAVRAIVQPMKETNSPEYTTRYVEVNLKDSEDADCMVLEPGKTLETMVMLPQLSVLESGEDLKLTIYTKEGVIKDINLSHMHSQKDDLQSSGVLLAVDPADKAVQRVEFTIDNSAVVKYPTVVTINNENDLRQWVGWLNSTTENTGTKFPVAIFTNDIVIDDVLAEGIESLRDNYILTIISGAEEGNNLKFATRNHPDVLEKLNVASNVKVEVMSNAVLNLSEKSYNIIHKFMAIEGYPEVPAGQLHIEVAKGGALKVVSNDKTAIQGGYDESGKPVAERTEVDIKNNGTVDVEAEELLGINIINDGVLNVKAVKINNEKTVYPSIYFAPESVNNIKGTINVDGGSISGTILNHFENRGIINNSGAISNIINRGNTDNLMPGTINIGEGADTDLTYNSGIVDYHENLIPVSFNNTGTGIVEDNAVAAYKYEGKGVNVSALSDAKVTDAVIISGNLTVDEFVTTLKTLVMKDNTGIVPAPAVNPVMRFAAEEDKGLGSLILEGGSSVKGVRFYNLMQEDKAVIVKGETVEFTDNVGFYSSPSSTNAKTVAVYFKEALLKNYGTFTAYKLENIGYTKSRIENKGKIKLEELSHDNITITVNEPVNE